MKDNIGIKIILLLSVILFVSFIGLNALVVTSILGSGKFYTPLILVFAVGLISYTGIMLFNLGKPKIISKIFIVFILLCGLIVIGYELNKSYHRRIPTVSEEEVDLNQYKPFNDKSKVISLNVPATLKIESDLPKLDGATALYPLYASFVQAVYPKNEYNIYNSDVRCSKTSEAYERLINGEVDIIFVARPSQQQIEMAKNKGVEFKLTPIGREAFVFFVNSKNSVKELSTQQIRGIYSGKITNWKEVGGKNQIIKAFQRPENSGSQTMLQKFMEGETLITPPKEDVVAGMGGIIEQTANYRNYQNAIGYSFLFFATEMVRNNQIRLLKIDGVEPNRNTINNQKYPLTAEFYAVTTGSKNPHVEAFLQWILSPQGQYLVEKTGYTPIR